eukprot:CAMPEP_0184745184 /NCGR_PEP_ID=MMETSP0315-20130426/7851_1 /TAXON_ID=101924 /ORGANISM="Rhodosorus marinus, Strain UTEX LB 2760" /LENGTH=268 /DNA_ID=CAMNT_0027217207 /DNA_START=52 /DNA_END=858 /DNA_ORIENTATION=+
MDREEICFVQVSSSCSSFLGSRLRGCSARSSGVILRNGSRQWRRKRRVEMWTPGELFEFVMQPKVLIPSVTVGSFAISTQWFEYGPRKPENNSRLSEPYVLRVKNSAQRKVVELPNGVGFGVENGETLLRARNREELFAMRKTLERTLGSACAYEVFLCTSTSVTFVASFPDRAINARQGEFPEGQVSDLDDVWSKYFLLFLDDVDRQWISYRDRLVLISKRTEAECRLCGGLGKVKCSRCGGAGGECEVCTGQQRVECKWCQGSGRA